jgi:hypothetical protein
MIEERFSNRLTTSAMPGLMGIRLLTELFYLSRIPADYLCNNPPGEPLSLVLYNRV